MRFPDPRSQGSQNPGATNVLRIAGKKAAALTLVGDMLKGLLPVLLANYLWNDPILSSLIGLAAFIGHCFPVFFGFNGGKGVATAIGATIAFHWPSGLFVIAIWLLVAKVLKISSIAALIAFLLLPAFIYWQLESIELCLIFSFITAVLTIRHKANIQRLINGTEV